MTQKSIENPRNKIIFLYAAEFILRIVLMKLMIDEQVIFDSYAVLRILI